MYFSFLLVSVVPVTLDAVQPPIWFEPRRWAEEIFVVFHCLVLSAFTIATAAAAVPQSRQTMRVKCLPECALVGGVAPADRLAGKEQAFGAGVVPVVCAAAATARGRRL
ncbi:hypothetical protein LZ32DRAFT_601830 [Colletotrichum eremochloae]|nr:hypothetical protein LZ32DRAFT_601830 [Colletotrichum eremochloae]